MEEKEPGIIFTLFLISILLVLYNIKESIRQPEVIYFLSGILTIGVILVTVLLFQRKKHRNEQEEN